MKKTILSVMIAVVSVFTFDAVAQNNRNCGDGQCKKEACDKAKPCSRADMKKAPCPFDGLNLTPDQQERLKALKPDCKMSKDKMKRHRQQCDSMAKAARRKHLDDVKAILTPGQYVQFLENIAMQQGKPGRPMMTGRKHNKGNCAPQAGNCAAKHDGKCPKTK